MMLSKSLFCVWKWDISVVHPHSVIFHPCNLCRNFKLTLYIFRNLSDLTLLHSCMVLDFIFLKVRTHGNEVNDLYNR